MYLVSLPFREISMGKEQQTRGAGGSRFAAACGLLRQYMKEQVGREAAVTMDLMPGANCVAGAEERIKKTMELFPQRAGTLNDNSHERYVRKLAFRRP